MKAVYFLFGTLVGIVAVLWTQAQTPLPQPALVHVEVTRVVEVTPTVRVGPCADAAIWYANLDGQLVHCRDGRYEWRAK